MIELIVTVDDDHRTSISDVANALRARGMQNVKVHLAIGVITGSVAEAEPSLHDIEGVQSVNAQLTFQHPDPDSPVQ
jgi:hypothetical protein